MKRILCLFIAFLVFIVNASGNNNCSNCGIGKNYSKNIEQIDMISLLNFASSDLDVYLDFYNYINKNLPPEEAEKAEELLTNIIEESTVNGDTLCVPRSTLTNSVKELKTILDGLLKSCN
ncbi:MAG: hypothetical protein SVN78_07305 [Deferribacterota bacterium]|nr:hypothetical protein [Deferribacterota bacterium]